MRKIGKTRLNAFFLCKSSLRTWTQFSFINSEISRKKNTRNSDCTFPSWFNVKQWNKSGDRLKGFALVQWALCVCRTQLHAERSAGPIIWTPLQIHIGMHVYLFLVIIMQTISRCIALRYRNFCNLWPVAAHGSFSLCVSTYLLYLII